MDRKPARPMTLEESKLQFILAAQMAQAGWLGRLRVRHLAMGAFAVGVTLGAVPAARRVLVAALRNYLDRPAQSAHQASSHRVRSLE